MLKEKGIITKLPITQAGQIVHFQVKIPRDALRVIGMEVSARYSNMQVGQPIGIVGIGFNIPSQHSYARLARRSVGETFQFTQDLFLGDLRLQSCEDTNVFFAENVYFADENLGYGDFSAINPRFQPVSETHGYKRYECVVNTDGETTILKGIYRDRQSSQQNSPQIGGIFFQYEVRVYVWYEKKCKEA